MELLMKIFPVIMLVAIVTIGILYAKNIQYRRRLERQGELEKLGEITRTLAHEIKNPLGAMQIHTGYLKKILPIGLHGELAVLEEEIARLNLLTRRISDFVRDPIGMQENIDCNLFLGDIARKHRSQVSLHVEGDASYTVRFDRERLRSVVENLIMNGIESYGPEPPRDRGPLVVLGLHREKGRVVLSVTDRGSGIPEKIRKRVFDPFFSTKTTGSGIGLAISRRFIEAAGGTIELLPGAHHAQNPTIGDTPSIRESDQSRSSASPGAGAEIGGPGPGTIVRIVFRREEQK
jgi:two-component system sensor histidine kinase HydH